MANIKSRANVMFDYNLLLEPDNASSRQALVQTFLDELAYYAGKANEIHLSAKDSGAFDITHTAGIGEQNREKLLYYQAVSLRLVFSLNLFNVTNDAILEAIQDEKVKHYVKLLIENQERLISEKITVKTNAQVIVDNYKHLLVKRKANVTSNEEKIHGLAEVEELRKLQAEVEAQTSEIASMEKLVAEYDSDELLPEQRETTSYKMKVRSDKSSYTDARYKPDTSVNKWLPFYADAFTVATFECLRGKEVTAHNTREFYDQVQEQLENYLQSSRRNFFCRLFKLQPAHADYVKSLKRQLTVIFNNELIPDKVKMMELMQAVAQGGEELNVRKSTKLMLGLHALLYKFWKLLEPRSIVPFYFAVSAEPAIKQQHKKVNKPRFGAR